MRCPASVVVAVLLVTGCATTQRVTLDTGQGPPREYQPVASAPIALGEREFRATVAQLVLELELSVSPEPPEADTRHSLLASNGAVVDGAWGRTAPSSDARVCERQQEPDECLGLLEQGRSLGLTQRRLTALSFALDTVWQGAALALRDIAHPAALRAMVTTLIGTALVMLVAPEPVTKFVALALTAYLIAYLGTGPVWNIAQAFLRLMHDTRDDTASPRVLREAGHRFGRVLGDNGTRVLVVVALTLLGGKSALSSPGPRLPGFAQAALKAQAEGGFSLPGALAGQVRSIALPAAGVLNVVLAPTALAAMAMGPGDGIQGDPDGDVHHICTDKNEVSAASGGPWTPAFVRYFKQAGMKLSDPANQVRIKGHKGPHPRAYHEEVLRRINRAMQTCRSTAHCKAALVDELGKLAHDLMTAGTKLRKLITKNPET